ncbi:MAG: MarR family transcriptional regulator [Pseudomonadales bacterium]|jgi:DNA-binding MarR family transcriptional regulator|nr:MarR family transcriptional regulator [Pseudomonadales bacterium]
MSSNRPADTLGFLFHDVARMMRWEFDRRAGELGLTRAQWQVLACLLRLEGAQQKELADLMDITPITLTGLLDRLERDGWVERRADPADRRAKRVYLTDKVEPVTKSVRKIGVKVCCQALDGLDEAEQTQLTHLLLRIRSNLCGRDKSENEVGGN